VVSCWSEGSSPAIRDKLAWVSFYYDGPDWEPLFRVKDFLQRQGVRDKELTCYFPQHLALYIELDVAPSNRFSLAGQRHLVFPEPREEIRRPLEKSGQRYVVSDLYAAGVPSEKFEPDKLGLPVAFPKGFRDSFHGRSRSSLTPGSAIWFMRFQGPITETERRCSVRVSFRGRCNFPQNE